VPQIEEGRLFFTFEYLGIESEELGVFISPFLVIKEQSRERDIRRYQKEFSLANSVNQNKTTLSHFLGGTFSCEVVFCKTSTLDSP
jgi:hypothetical protein